MSGGVDSSVAAGLLKKQGHDVVGVTMCFNISHGPGRRPSCCGAQGIDDARRAAGILGIPHYVLSFAGDIQKVIIENFMQEYSLGRTPNPCVRCNQFIKFGSLYAKIKSLGGHYLATGHYARVAYSRRKRIFQLKKAVDGNKDQTYFLYGIPREILPNVLFPVGDFEKKQVRHLARTLGLNTAEKEESQDLCFIPGRLYQQFLQEKLGQKAFKPGWFRDEQGKILGQHQGIMNYTIGQRERLGLSLGRRVYVFRIHAKSNTVYVGPEETLLSSGLKAGPLNALSPDLGPGGPIPVRLKIRYHAAEVPGFLTVKNSKKILVEFRTPQKSVTPGQSVVFYKGDVVLGGAVIDEAVP